MPCRYYSEDEERQMASQKAEELRQTNADLVAKLNETTRLLCGVMETLGLRAQVLVVKQVQGLEKWCQDHNLRDKRRERAEKKERLSQLHAEMTRLREEHQKLEGELTNLDTELPEG